LALFQLQYVFRVGERRSRDFIESGTLLGARQKEEYTLSIDTTFHPITQTIQVGAAAVQVATDTQLDAQTFRVRCLSATSVYLTWGNSSTITAKGAPGASPVFNTLGMIGVGAVMYIEVPANSFFIASAAAAFEITGGKGGVGG
jgi:hypothetical protein